MWPDRGNSFWLSLHGGIWYLSTWLPVCYRIPGDQDVVAVCSACMGFGTSAMYRVPDEIAARFVMEQISDDEFERLFPARPNQGAAANPAIASLLQSDALAGRVAELGRYASGDTL